MTSRMQFHDPREDEAFSRALHYEMLSDTRRLEPFKRAIERTCAGTLLDAHADQREAAVHRVRAASCYQKAGDPSRATNLDRAALARPLRAVTRKDFERMLAECLAHLSGSRPPNAVNVSSGS